MKKIVTFSILAMLFISCSTQYKLKGNYPSGNFFTETELSYDEVWDKVIDYFATTGFAITTIDRSSGFISSNASFENTCTRENKGIPLNPNAYVVIPTLRGGFGNVIEPGRTLSPKSSWVITGDWNVRIKRTDNGTMVNVNLVNLKCLYSAGYSTSRIPIKSLGNFENGLLNYLTK